MVTNDTNPNDANFEKTLSKLANFSYKFDTNSDEKALDTKLTEHIILQTLASINIDWYPVEELQKDILELFDLSFDTMEIKDCLDSLCLPAKSPKVIKKRRTGKKEGEVYKIDESIRIRINNESSDKKDRKLRVIQEWLNQIETELEIRLSIEQKDYLQEDIEIYIGRLM